MEKISQKSTTKRIGVPNLKLQMDGRKWMGWNLNSVQWFTPSKKALFWLFFRHLNSAKVFCFWKNKIVKWSFRKIWQKGLSDKNEKAVLQEKRHKQKHSELFIRDLRGKRFSQINLLGWVGEILRETSNLQKLIRTRIKIVTKFNNNHGEMGTKKGNHILKSKRILNRNETKTKIGMQREVISR